MGGFTDININTVKIKHFSTASIIRITFTHNEETQQGNTEEVITEQYFSYAEFSDLKKAINLTDDWL